MLPSTFFSLLFPKENRMTTHLVWEKYWLIELPSTNTLGSVGWNRIRRGNTKLTASSLKTFLFEISFWFVAFLDDFSRHLLLFPYKLFQRIMKRWVKKIFSSSMEKRKYRLFLSLFWSFFPWLSSQLHKLFLRSKHNSCYHWTNICSSKCAEVSFHWPVLEHSF